jgi:outer membrane protein OmpA-like peptidoglycan-associated protein
MRPLLKRHPALSGVVILALAATTMGTAKAMATSSAGVAPPAVETPSVPVLGRIALKEDSATGKPAAVGTLHGVRSIPGGTVIYYSLGYPAATQGRHSIISLEELTLARTRTHGTSFASNMLVDPLNKKVYSGLVPSGNVSVAAGKTDCICSSSATSGVLDNKAGQAKVYYQVIAALPESVAFVDVFISGQVIGHVKVDKGPMTPEVDASKPIVVGMGWPKIDQNAVSTSSEPAKSVVDLKTSVADLAGTVTTRANPKQISVELAADVLFATDSATLSSRAQVLLARAAADVKAAGGAGVLQVRGYTDDTGSTSHNVDLSGRRAASVAAAIKPLLPAGVTLPTSGMGEADPVAPNTTPEGRAVNRRVSIVFAPRAGTR